MLAAQRLELESRGPLIEVDEWGSVQSLRYDHRSIAPLDLAYEDMVPFYRAYRMLADLLRQPEFGYRMAIRPGECLVLDNQRVLHGRERETDPSRRLQGCYLARDWVEGRYFARNGSENAK